MNPRILLSEDEFSRFVKTQWKSISFIFRHKSDADTGMYIIFMDNVTIVCQIDAAEFDRKEIRRDGGSIPIFDWLEPMWPGVSSQQ